MSTVSHGVPVPTLAVAGHTRPGVSSRGSSGDSKRTVHTLVWAKSSDPHFRGTKLSNPGKALGPGFGALTLHQL